MEVGIHAVGGLVPDKRVRLRRTRAQTAQEQQAKKNLAHLHHRLD
jgi:hypothetical protein